MRTRAMTGMAVAMVLLGGCATRMDTRSGGPEVTIKGVPIKTVRTAYEHELADEGFAVRHDKAGNVIGMRNASWIEGDTPLFDGSFRRGNKAIARLDFLQEDDGVRVVYRGFIGGVSFRGAIEGDEAREDWKDRQVKLERVAKELEAAR